MTRLAITLACGDYDRTRALADGRVAVEGTDLTVLALGRRRSSSGWPGSRSSTSPSSRCPPTC